MGTSGSHRSYGEYIAKDSWKQYLAEDIIQCIRDSNNLADFKLLLENRGVECDIGRKSILFTVQAGTYGLAEERKCSNIRLMSYGNFTSENILQSIQFNSFLLDTAWHDFPLVSEILGALGKIDHPDDPQAYERIFQENLQPADFKGKTKLQIEQMLAERKFQELLATQTKAIREKIAAEQAQSAILHNSIAGLFDQFEEWLWEKKCKEEMLNYEQQITGDTKEAENDEYELY